MLDAVTGAFSFSGRAIARRLVEEGHEVVTLIRRTPDRDPFDGAVRMALVDLADPATLLPALQDVDTLYNTHWIRFPRGGLTYETAIAHTRNLVSAAREAGVRRLVHLSVVNAAESSPTPYFVAKARLEAEVKAMGVSHAIVRPTMTFGPGDILVNNLCWVLRRFPAFAVPGDGRFRLQPVHVDDVAAIAVTAGQRTEDLTLDAAGPEVLAFDDFVRILARAVDRRPWLVHAPPLLSLVASRLLGLLVNDILLTRDEVTELTSSLLVSSQSPLGTTRISEWAPANAGLLGRAYHSELARHYRVRGP